LVALVLVPEFEGLVREGRLQSLRILRDLRNCRFASADRN